VPPECRTHRCHCPTPNNSVCPIAVAPQHRDDFTAAASTSGGISPAAWRIPGRDRGKPSPP
jgi:hypothetical protein